MQRFAMYGRSALTPDAPRVRRERRIVGIDASLTSTGYAYLREGVPVTSHIPTGDLRGPARLFYIEERIANVLKLVQPSIVVIEDYAMNMKRQGAGRAYSIGELGGVLRLLAHRNGANVELVSPTTLKKFISGVGKGSDKTVVQRAILAQFGYNVTQNDEADALALLLFGQVKYNGLQGGFTKPVSTIVHPGRLTPRS